MKIETKESINAYLIICLILLIVFGSMVYIIFSIENTYRIEDSIYEDLCYKNNLTLYKSTPDKLHYDSCYSMEGDIIKFYKIAYWNGNSNRPYLKLDNGL